MAKAIHSKGNLRVIDEFDLYVKKDNQHLVDGILELYPGIKPSSEKDPLVKRKSIPVRNNYDLRLAYLMHNKRYNVMIMTDGFAYISLQDNEINPVKIEYVVEPGEVIPIERLYYIPKNIFLAHYKDVETINLLPYKNGDLYESWTCNGVRRLYSKYGFYRYDECKFRKVCSRYVPVPNSTTHYTALDCFISGSFTRGIHETYVDDRAILYNEDFFIQKRIPHSSHRDMTKPGLSEKINMNLLVVHTLDGDLKYQFDSDIFSEPDQQLYDPYDLDSEIIVPDFTEFNDNPYEFKYKYKRIHIINIPIVNELGEIQSNDLFFMKEIQR